MVTIYFMTMFPKIRKQHDSIMMMVDKLKKTAHFILVKSIHKTLNILHICMKEIVRLHWILEVMVSVRHPKFNSNFLGLFKGFGIYLNLSTTYHPQTNVKAERKN